MLFVKQMFVKLLLFLPEVAKMITMGGVGSPCLNLGTSYTLRSSPHWPRHWPPVRILILVTLTTREKVQPYLNSTLWFISASLSFSLRLFSIALQLDAITMDEHTPLFPEYARDTSHFILALCNLCTTKLTHNPTIFLPRSSGDSEIIGSRICQSY